MQPHTQHLRASLGRPSHLGRHAKSAGASSAVATRSHIVASAERPREPTPEVSFVVTDTFVHEDFSVLSRHLRSREETPNEITAVVRSPELSLTFTGLSSGDILYFQHDVFGPPPTAAAAERLRGHSGAVQCLHFALNTQPEAFPGLSAAGTAAEDRDVGGQWLLSGSADRTIRIWSISGKHVECIRTIGGHGGTIVSLALCMPYLISSSTDGSLSFFVVDVSSRKEPTFSLVQKLQSGSAHTSTVKGMAVLAYSWFESVTAKWAGDKVRVCASSTDGWLFLLEGGGSGAVQEFAEFNAKGTRPPRWCREVFTIYRKMQVHSLCTRIVYALPLESVVVTAGSDTGIAVVDPYLGEVWWKQANPQGVSFSALAWDAKQSLLLAGDDSGTLSYFNIYSKEIVASQQISDHKILHISVDTEADRIVVGSAHSVLIVRAKHSNTELHLSGHEGAVSHLLWLSMGGTRLLLSMAADKTFLLWDLQRATAVSTIHCKHAEVTSFTFLTGLDVLLTGHEDGSVRFWQLPSDSSFPVLDRKGKTLHENTVACMESWSGTTEQSNDNKGLANSLLQPEFKYNEFYVLTGGYDGNICLVLVNEIDGRIVARQSELYRSSSSTDQEVLYLAVCYSKGLFFSAGNGKDINRYCLEDPTEVIHLEGHTDSITALKTVENLLVSGSLDRTIRLWQPHAAECLHVIMQLEDPPFCILAISPSPGGATGWASITREGTVSFWKGSTFREAINLNAPLASATEVLELDVLLTGTEDGKILSVPLPT